MTSNAMRRVKFATGFIVIALLFIAMPAWSASKAAQQKDVQKMSRETLARLYKVEPSAKKVIAKSAGYAVFENFGMKILVAGSGKGSGMAVNNKTKKITYMKMLEVQAGLGIGIKKFRLVWVFESQKLLDQFINSGWELGAQTSAAAKTGNKGAEFAGAMSVSPGIWLYQLTDDGLALELTAKGTKYYKDDDLN
jgi:lipid-binding SYLF domain-containing protein